MARLRDRKLRGGLTRLGLVAICLLIVVAWQCIAQLHGSEIVTSQRIRIQAHSDEVDRGYEPPTQLGNLQDTSIKESSGLAASHTTPGSYWTHNDSGSGPFIFAFDSLGNRRGVWRVAGASAQDWEDIASGPGPDPRRNYLYIGDIGDNSLRRSEITVYRIPEPVIRSQDAASSLSKPLTTEQAEVFRFKYPEGKHDSEALLVHPTTGNIYVITKVLFSNPEVYEGSALVRPGVTTPMVRVGELNLRTILGGIVTGGAISPDGKRVALCDYQQGYELVLPNGADFSSIWKQPIKTIALGKRKQGEAITYRLDGRALLVTSEGSRTPLNQIVRR